MWLAEHCLLRPGYRNTDPKHFGVRSANELTLPRAVRRGKPTFREAVRARALPNNPRVGRRGPALNRGNPLAMRHRQGERTSQQPYGTLDIRFGMQKQADPARFGKNVMGLGLAPRNDFVANEPRKRNIDEAVAVDMSELTPAEAELHAAEPVPRRGDFLPPAHDFADVVLCSGDRHDSDLPSAAISYLPVR
jgi:hypothetical protein